MEDMFIILLKLYNPKILFITFPIPLNDISNHQIFINWIFLLELFLIMLKKLIFC